MKTIKSKTDQKKNYTGQASKKDRSAEEDSDELMNGTMRIKADRVENLLENVSSKMDILDLENFDTLFPDFISNMKEATILREELIKRIGSEELIKLRPELFSTAKKIEKKYDNIVEKYLQEEKNA